MTAFHRPLDQANALRPLLIKAQALLELQAVFRQILPPGLVNSARPVNVEDGTVVVLADHSAAAARIRQNIPSILIHLKKRAWQVSAIRVRVQVKIAAPRPVAAAPRVWTEAAQQAWQTLEQQLDQPDSRLGRAIARLLESQQTRRGR